MAVTVDTDSYGTEAGLNSYADARGITITNDETELLIQAMDWLETQSFHSYKYVESQALEFPRALRLYGDTAGVVPLDIVAAQYVAALLIDSGETLNPTVDRAVKREKVDVIEVEYMDNADSSKTFPQLTALLKNYLSTYGGSFKVSRG